MTTSPQRSPDFRPDPLRAIFLSEDIEQPTLDRLTPTLLRLQGEDRGPVTMYIDSYGGNVWVANSLFRILKAADQDGAAPCRLITVVTGVAASAAADLLMSGDYALAYPHATILCHGVRQRSRAEALTQEKAIDLARDLASSNERFAIQLADNCISRFIFRVATTSPEFPQVRERVGKPTLSHAKCFIEVLKGRVSSRLIEVLEEALRRSQENDDLDVFASRSMTGKDLGTMPQAKFEVLLFGAILDFEAQQHSDDAKWSFRTQGGLGRIQDKLELLLDKYGEHHSTMTAGLCARWGAMFLTPEQEIAFEPLLEAERSQEIQFAVEEILRALWFFFVSICRALQKDDYWMGAEEAYWLGLIDEVIGRTDLPCPRLFVEYPPPAASAPKAAP
jgi:ATP-dependent protease ClpP protease subunit